MNTTLSLTIALDKNHTPDDALAKVNELVSRYWLPSEFTAEIDHRDPRFSFDMLLVDCECCTCKRAMERGDLVRCRPIEGSRFNVCNFQCAECAKAEVLPIFDAERSEVKP